MINKTTNKDYTDQPSYQNITRLMHVSDIIALTDERLRFDHKKCQNGGTCVDGVDNYTCIYPTGLTGVNCQTIA